MATTLAHWCSFTEYQRALILYNDRPQSSSEMTNTKTEKFVGPRLLIQSRSRVRCQADIYDYLHQIRARHRVDGALEGTLFTKATHGHIHKTRDSYERKQLDIHIEQKSSGIDQAIESSLIVLERATLLVLCLHHHLRILRVA